MAKHTMPNQWTLAALRDAVGVLPRPQPWRLVEPAVYGQVHGLPGTAGVAVATNGILVCIVRQSGPFIGHLESFEAYEQSGARVLVKLASPKAKRARSQGNQNVTEFY